MARIVKRTKSRKITAADVAAARRIMSATLMAVIKERTGLSEDEIKARVKGAGEKTRAFMADIAQLIKGGK